MSPTIYDRCVKAIKKKNKKLRCTKSEIKGRRTKRERKCVEPHAVCTVTVGRK